MTHCTDAFNDLLAGNETFAIRFFGMRTQDGLPGADCRVNGMDYERGKEALRSYVGSWPGQGFELRKQYVVIHEGPPQ